MQNLLFPLSLSYLSLLALLSFTLLSPCFNDICHGVVSARPMKSDLPHKDTLMKIPYSYSYSSSILPLSSPSSSSSTSVPSPSSPQSPNGGPNIKDYRVQSKSLLPVPTLTDFFQDPNVMLLLCDAFRVYALKKIIYSIPPLSKSSPKVIKRLFQNCPEPVGPFSVKLLMRPEKYEAKVQSVRKDNPLSKWFFKSKESPLSHSPDRVDPMEYTNHYKEIMPISYQAAAFLGYNNADETLLADFCTKILTHPHGRVYQGLSNSQFHSSQKRQFSNPSLKHYCIQVFQSVHQFWAAYQVRAILVDTVVGFDRDEPFNPARQAFMEPLTKKEMELTYGPRPEDRGLPNGKPRTLKQTYLDPVFEYVKRTAKPTITFREAEMYEHHRDFFLSLCPHELEALISQLDNPSDRPLLVNLLRHIAYFPIIAARMDMESLRKNSS
ncbi:MAG: hypothetical protein DHS80DRAFT_22315 [Piptocephalis tieghemiana]|nr:MAG: hypothetical protein DHS80DRAFT_22315 [Piptocephalis tieghemiana]